MMIKHNIRFGLRGTNASGRRSIRARVSWGGRVVEVSLPYAITEAEWDARAQTTTNARARLAMSELAANVDRLFLTSDNVTTDDVRAVLGLRTSSSGDSATNVTIGSLMARYMAEYGRESQWSQGTVARYRTLMAHWQAFGDIPAREFGEDTLRSFVSHLYSAGLVNSTVSKNLRTMQGFLRWCNREGHMQSREWERYSPKIKQIARDVIYLTRDELKEVMEHEFMSETMRHVRDVFVLQCFTGLRYSDVQRLKVGDVRDGAIHLVTKKTSQPLTIDLNAVSSHILGKYSEGKARGDAALPTMSNQKANDYLKEMARECGITSPVRRVWMVKSVRREEVVEKWELISTHCGRRTFITQGLSMGITAEVMMRFTGHSTYSAMKPYIDIVAKAKADAMAKFDTLAGDIGSEDLDAEKQKGGR